MNGRPTGCPGFPDRGSSINGSSSLDQCTCSPGYTFKLVGAIASCVQCTAGSICQGGTVIAVQVSQTPVVGVATQIILVQQPMPATDNMVDLIMGIPAQLAKIARLLNITTVASRQICRGAYCISCDGSPTCLPKTTIGIGQGSKYTFNATAIATDTLVFMVRTRPGFCAPSYSGITSEYMKGNTFVISSLSSITSVTLTCPMNTALTNSIPVKGTVGKAARRLLSETSGRRHLTQISAMDDSLEISMVVSTNQTSAAQEIIAAANMTVQGFMDATVVDVPVVEAECPMNSTSPIGAISLRECFCMPGYRGNASLGTPCSPCDIGEYCSGGIMGLCPPTTTAPPMSNDADDCVCNLGFYGPANNCQQCPPNSYCMGGKRFNCTANAVSPAQSANPQSCFCKAGLYGIDNQPCQSCPPGFWCPGGAQNVCPANWTSNANSSLATDCFCQDGFESVSTRDSSGHAINVCQACADSTYCKVRSSPIPIYNTPIPHTPECERLKPCSYSL